jgi:hypothetical protein
MADACHDAFVARARRLDQVARWLSRAPECVLAAVARRLCQLHPFGLSGEQYRAGLRQGLRIGEDAAYTLWRRYLLRETIGLFHYRGYRRIDQRWLARRVRIEADTGGWRPSDGGLVLTYHLPEWHLLCSLLGLLGGKVYAVAQPPEASPLESGLRGYLDDLHQRTARHFRGGDYLFVRDGRQALAQAEARLREGAVVVALTDQHNDETPGRASARLFGRRVCPRAGVVRSALALGRPIVAASLEFDPETRHYRVALRAVAARTLAGVLEAYFGHLESWLRERPDVWAGWRDFERLAEY